MAKKRKKTTKRTTKKTTKRTVKTASSGTIHLTIKAR